MSGEPWSSDSACMCTSTMSPGVAVVGVRSTGAGAMDGAELMLFAEARPGGEPMLMEPTVGEPRMGSELPGIELRGIELMLPIEPMLGMEPMLDAEPMAGVEIRPGVALMAAVEAVPGVGVMAFEDVPDEADARATGMGTGCGRGVGMPPRAGVATWPFALPRRPDCVSDTVGCGMRCERRLLRSIMLMAQASRSTGVRFEAWMNGSVSWRSAQIDTKEEHT